MVNTPIPIFFVNDMHIINLFVHMIIMILPVPLLLHVEKICVVQNKRLYYSVYIVLLLNFIVQTILCNLKLFDFHDMMFVTHLIILYVAVVILHTVSIDKKAAIERKDPTVANKRIYHFSLVVFFAAMMIDVVRMYVVSTYDTSFFTRIAMMILALCALIVSIREISEFSKLTLISSTVHKMAYTDPLTNLANRASFEQCLDTTELNKHEHRTIAILVFDVNCLKHVNDTYGHQQGDKLIISAANAIRASFDNEFTTYRIGGDEFASIYAGEQTNSYINAHIENFSQTIEKFNLNLPPHLQLSVAVGVAFMSGSGNEAMSDLFRRADRIMYDNKKAMKAAKAQ
jgi:diguanylate cyclase (GGDEF)-like protein